MEALESGEVRAAPRRRGSGIYRGMAWRQKQVKKSTTEPGVNKINAPQHNGGRAGLIQVEGIVRSTR